MKRVLYLLISVIVFASCSERENELNNRISSDRTVLVYMLSGGNLNYELKTNIYDMFDALQNSNKACNMLIFWDNYDKSLSYPAILKLSADGYGNVNGISKTRYLADQKKTDKFNLIVKYSKVKEYNDENLNPVDKDFITQVLNDMVTLVPSKNYGLIFGSHAQSWIPPKNKNGSRMFASSGYGDGIGIPELNEALLGVFNSSKKFDFILMDACMMGSIEVAYELQNTCSYYIASPMEIPSIGFPYSKIVPYLFSNDYMDYTKKVCELYAATANWGNCVALDCGEITDFTYELKKYIYSYTNIDLSSVVFYHNRYKSDFKGLSYDILDFVNKSTNDNVSSSFRRRLDRLIVGKAFSMSVASDFYSFKDFDTSTICGLGMYVPVASRVSWNTYLINKLLWGNTSGWSSYIERNNFLN